jgi:hypothetical protein
MAIATLSSKFQLSLQNHARSYEYATRPAIRRLIRTGEIIQLVPKTSIRDLRGRARGAKSEGTATGRTVTDGAGGYLRLDRVDDRFRPGETYAPYLASENLLVPTLVPRVVQVVVPRDRHRDGLSRSPPPSRPRWCLWITSLALLAADIAREHKLATADAIVYATARQSRDAGYQRCAFRGLAGGPVLSENKKLRLLPGGDHDCRVDRLCLRRRCWH